MSSQRHIEHARFLLQQGRNDQAKKELDKALHQDPNHSETLGLLTVYHLQIRAFPEALKTGKKALQQNPSDPFIFLITARAAFYNQKIEEAQHLIAEGQRIIPTASAFYQLRAEIALYQEDWERTLAEANLGLALDPEDVELINIRAKALSLLNRQQEASETLEYALRQNPHSSDSHANKGWVLIEQDRYDEAISTFREALRLRPTSDFAKNGLKEAIKGKNILYRIVLKYFLAMQKLTAKGQWLVIIGLYVLFRILRALAENNEQLEMLLMPLFVIYLFFIFSSWIARPLSNIFLRFHPLGKLALTEDEIKGSNIVGALLLSGVTLLCLGGLFLELLGEPLAGKLSIAGIVCIALLIPTGGTFAMSEGSKARKLLMYYTFTLSLLGLLFVISEQIIFGILAGIGLFAFGWVANYIMSQEAKKF